MNKLIFTLSAITLFASCNSTTKKADKIEDKINQTNQPAKNIYPIGIDLKSPLIVSKVEVLSVDRDR